MKTLRDLFANPVDARRLELWKTKPRAFQIFISRITSQFNNLDNITITSLKFKEGNKLIPVIAVLTVSINGLTSQYEI